MTPITIAPTLREVAELKIAEFDQLKKDFKTRYGIDSPRPADISVRERISVLVKDIERFDSYLEDDDDLTNIATCLEQIDDDSCVSDAKLQKLEEKILDKLRKRMSRYDATSLHMDLVKEAMDINRCDTASVPGVEALSLDDDFDIVDDGLERIWDKFEVEAFISKDIDAQALEKYLEGLLEDNVSPETVSRLHSRMREYGGDILVGDGDIEEDELAWCIMDLLGNELVSNEKKKILEGYLQNQAAIKELLGVLNMKSVTNWNYKHADKGVPVTARQDADGKYHVTVEEDLIDMLYLHCMAIGWAQRLKDCLGDYFRFLDRVYKRDLTLEESRKREFFLDTVPSEPVPVSPPESPDFYVCGIPPPPPPMPASWGIPHGVYVTPVSATRPKTKKGKARKAIHDPMAGMGMPPLPPPPPPPGIVVIPPPPPPLPYMSSPPLPLPVPTNLDTVDDERRRTYKRDFFMSRLPTQDGCRPKVIPVEEVQANLIKTLAAEIKIRSGLGDQPSCSVVDFHSLASSLPHKTVLVVLKVLGIPDQFLDFFARFLGSSLNIGPSVRGTRDRVVARACGVPERHGMELLFTEAVMFFTELSVAKKTGLHLYRLGSLCYFVGDDTQTEQAMQEMAVFSGHTKLEFDDVLPRNGHFDIGFLGISHNTTIIRKALVEEYALRAKRELSAQTTVYDWVRIWNDKIGTYAAHLFGPLIDLFGKSHLEEVKAAYKRIFDIIFEGGNLTDHVKGMLRARSDFARTAPSLALEAFIYLPQSFGGLGVKNPFVTFNLARNMIPDPSSVITSYLEVEHSYYEAAKTNWAVINPLHISKKLSYIFDDEADAIAASLGSVEEHYPFMYEAALTHHRDHALFPHLPLALTNDIDPAPGPVLKIPYLQGLYQTLLSASVEEIPSSERLRDEVEECGPTKRWDQLDVLDQWALSMYGEECLETFGSLDVWCEKFVPEVALVLIRGVPEGNRDAYSDMTSVY